MTKINEIEKTWKKIDKELEYVASYANVERRAELLNFLKGQFQELESTTRKEERELISSRMCLALFRDKESHYDATEILEKVRERINNPPLKQNQ